MSEFRIRTVEIGSRMASDVHLQRKRKSHERRITIPLVMAFFYEAKQRKYRIHRTRLSTAWGGGSYSGLLPAASRVRISGRSRTGISEKFFRKVPHTLRGTAGTPGRS